MRYRTLKWSIFYYTFLCYSQFMGKVSEILRIVVDLCLYNCCTSLFLGGCGRSWEDSNKNHLKWLKSSANINFFGRFMEGRFIWIFTKYILYLFFEVFMEFYLFGNWILEICFCNLWLSSLPFFYRQHSVISYFLHFIKLLNVL